MPRSGLVSVIMPAYNAAGYIEESIGSVCSQTYTDWELVVVDDVSTDNTCEVVRGIMKSDPRIRLLEMSKNGGPGFARARGIQEAKGRYVAFLDSDDVWLPNKLEKQIGFMSSLKCVLSFTQFRRMDGASGRIGRKIDVPASLSYRGLLANTAIALSSAVVDRVLVGEWDPPAVGKNYIEDYPLFYSILKKGHKALGLKEDLLRYRVRSDSFSRSKGKYATKVWRTYRDLEGLSLPVAAWFFSQYAIRGVLKYSRF